VCVKQWCSLRETIIDHHHHQRSADGAFWIPSGPEHAQNAPKTPQKAYRRRRAPRAGATWRTCLVRPQGPVRTPWERRDPQRGRSARGALLTSGRNLGAKMENAPNPKQAVSRHQLGQFHLHRALRGGRPVALTGPTRGATSRSLTRERWAIRATQLYMY
jgi:hypothetical protein